MLTEVVFFFKLLWIDVRYWFAIHIVYHLAMLAIYPIVFAKSIWFLSKLALLSSFCGRRAARRYWIHEHWHARKECWKSKLRVRESRLRAIEANAALSETLREEENAK